MIKLAAMNELITKAHAGHYAVPAFNVCNMENIQGILETAQEMRAPVIVQAHWLEVNYAGAATIVDMVKNIGADMDVTAAVHLDHGATFEDTIRCLRGGFTSVMYDGSLLPLEENIANLKKVVEMAHTVGVTVEGELGTIGQTSEMGEQIEGAYLTDPYQAGRLAKESGIDCLAVAIGNAHGFYTAEPKLDFERLQEIADQVSIPLVLHGGTGIPCEQIQKAITMGISKVNFSSALRKACITKMHEFLNEKPDEISLMDIMAAGKDALKTEVKKAIEMCMCADKY